MSTPEGRVKTQITKYLKSLGPECYYFMPIGGAYTVAGVPDYVGCFRGRFFSVEAKAPGKKPTALQVQQHQKIAASGGIVMVVDGDSALAQFRARLEGNHADPKSSTLRPEDPPP